MVTAVGKARQIVSDVRKQGKINREEMVACGDPAGRCAVESVAAFLTKRK